MDSDYNPNTQYTLPARTRKVYDPHSYRSHWDPNQASTNTPSATEQSAKAKQRHASKPQSPVRSAPKMQHAQRQPDSRPISQEQLAAEVKSIYAGLTMVETKCIHVDRAEAAAASDNSASIAPQAYTPITSARTLSGPDRSSMNPSSSATDDPDEFEVQDNKFAFSPGQLRKLLNPKSLGASDEFEVQNNKFAFSPGQLRKLLSPKSLGVVDALGGKDGIEKGLRTDRRTGLSLDEATLDGAAAISFDEATTQSTSPDKRIYIPGFLGNGNPSRVPIEALPDKCAKYNFMKESEAKRLRLAVNRDITCSITLTKNKTIRTVGVVVALFTFRGETESHPLEFHLLRDCIHEVILGKPFLKATKTFSDLALRARRVVTNFMTKCTSLQLNFLGDSAPMFTGLLNGRIRQGLGDTGAQAPIMDEAFARAEGWHIEDHPDDIRTVQFADGSTADTVGMAYGVKWKFGLGGHSADYVLDFHILKDAPAGIILSDEFLHDTQAFAAYDRYLFDVDDEDDDEEDKGHLCAIKISKKLDKQGVIAGATDYTMVQGSHDMAQEEQRRDDLERKQNLMQQSQSSSLTPSTNISPHVPLPPPNTSPPAQPVLDPTTSLPPIPLGTPNSEGSNSGGSTSVPAPTPAGSTIHNPDPPTLPPGIQGGTTPSFAQSLRTKMTGMLKRDKAVGS